VERFGLDKYVVNRILNTKNTASVALLLNRDAGQKFTTVLIAKGQNGDLLIDDGKNLETGGRA
jgi:hypothetical protein